MDLSKYAALFLAESREHLSACNRLLLEWEREPAATAPVGGLFRAIHTMKGMAATMGYAGVAELAHRLENLLDALRRRAAAPSAHEFQLLFRSVDALTAGGRRRRGRREWVAGLRVARRARCGGVGGRRGSDDHGAPRGVPEAIGRLRRGSRGGSPGPGGAAPGRGDAGRPRRAGAAAGRRRSER